MCYFSGRIKTRGTRQSSAAIAVHPTQGGQSDDVGAPGPGQAAARANRLLDLPRLAHHPALHGIRHMDTLQRPSASLRRTGQWPIYLNFIN